MCPHTNRLLLTAAQPSILSSSADIDDPEWAYLPIDSLFFFSSLILVFVFLSWFFLSPARPSQPVSVCVCGWFSLPRNLARNLLTSKVIRCGSHRPLPPSPPPPPPPPTSLPSGAVSHWLFSTYKGFVSHDNRAKIPRGIVSFETDVTDRVSLPLLYRRHSSP